MDTIQSIEGGERCVKGKATLLNLIYRTAARVRVLRAFISGRASQAKGGIDNVEQNDRRGDKKDRPETIAGRHRCADQWAGDVADIAK